MQAAMELARQPESEALVTEVLNRLSTWLVPANVFPRMPTPLFLTAFVDRNHELVARARIHVRLQDAAKYLAETLEMILAGIQDGSIDGFAGISPELSRLFLSNHEMYRRTYEDYRRVKEKNLSIMMLLITARHLASAQEEDIQPDDILVESIMQITSELIKTALSTRPCDLMPDVCAELCTFIRRALVGFEGEALMYPDFDREMLNDLNTLCDLIRAKIIAFDERVAAGVSV
jgi:hypothetical protein